MEIIRGRIVELILADAQEILPQTGSANVCDDTNLPNLVIIR